MRDEIFWDVQRVIRELDLHEEGAPVNITRLERVYVPYRVSNLAEVGIGGFASPLPDWLDPSEDTPAMVVVDEAEHEKYSWREIYCHEVGHLICNHLGSLRSLKVDEWFHSREEREAWEVAALLLIPTEVFEAGGTPEDIARSCDVHVDLALAFPKYWSRFL